MKIEVKEKFEKDEHLKRLVCYFKVNDRMTVKFEGDWVFANELVDELDVLREVSTNYASSQDKQLSFFSAQNSLTTIQALAKKDNTSISMSVNGGEEVKIA